METNIDGFELLRYAEVLVDRNYVDKNLGFIRVRIILTDDGKKYFHEMKNGEVSSVIEI